jgi:histidinol-phosphate/aromatic aminotransferase/cobyric acid decarboxylase-like protein
MIHNQHKQQKYRRSMDAEREDLQQATRGFMRSLFRTGASFALLPVKRLPQKPQQHFQAANRELTHGLATLVHEFADGIEGMAKDASTTTPFEEGPQSDGKLD